MPFFAENNKNCYIEGKNIEYHFTEKQAYIFGKYPDKISTKQAYIHGKISTTSNKRCFIEGWHLFTYSERNISLLYHIHNTKQCFLNAKYLSQKNAFIKGSINYIIQRFSYINGICLNTKKALAYHTIKKNTEKKCFITNYPYTQRKCYLNSVKNINSEKTILMPYNAIYKSQRYCKINRYSTLLSFNKTFSETYDTTSIYFTLSFDTTTTFYPIIITKEVNKIPFEVLFFNYDYTNNPFLILDENTSSLKDYVILKCNRNSKETFEFYLFPTINYALLYTETFNNQIAKVYINDIEISNNPNNKSKLYLIKYHAYKLKIITNILTSSNYIVNHFLHYEIPNNKNGSLIIKTFYI